MFEENTSFDLSCAQESAEAEPQSSEEIQDKLCVHTETFSFERLRHSFSRIPEAMSIPSLIELQRRSYDEFLQRYVPQSQRKNIGLQGALNAIFPVQDASGRTQLEFLGYELEEPKNDLNEARQKGLTHASPLRAKLRLSSLNEDGTLRFSREQDVFLGDIPLMTHEGTFVVNGVERVVVSQMHRSPGVFFDHDRGHSASGKVIYVARIIPSNGSWIDFEFDLKDILCVRIDRKRKLPVTTLLMALENTQASFDEDLEPFKRPGLSRQDILNLYYKTVSYTFQDGFWRIPFIENSWKNTRLEIDLIDADTGQILAAKGEKVTIRALRKFTKEGLKYVLLPIEHVAGHYSACDIIDKDTGEVYLEAGMELSVEKVHFLVGSCVESIEVLDIDFIQTSPFLRNTLLSDKNTTRTEALFDIYRVLRPGETPTLEGAYTLLHNLFFNPERYDLSVVGRLKINARLNLQTPLTQRVLDPSDLIEVVRYLLGLKQGQGHIDDIDSLTNRRVRSVGELLEVQYRSGLVRMQRNVRERMPAVDLETAMPNDLLNARPLSSIIREFFGTSQLSQFMDQTNPLSEVNHKRRISALGPGGLTRDRAGVEVRDVHPTHYGRICPVETPEGANIGLINSMAIYARINAYGFLETPYRKVIDGRLTDTIIYVSAMDEEKYKIAQADVPTDENGVLQESTVYCRFSGDFIVVSPQEVDFVDVSPKQILSVAASLIPFVENDDAKRALMGSNMQRQAVPLLRSQAPLVGTGIEGFVMRDAGVILSARREGIVDQVDSQRIVIRPTHVEEDDTFVDIYNLIKFRKSNAGTCIHQKPLVKAGQYVKAGEIIADGAATDRGELALGYNARVAFMSWKGYCFEDSIVLSQRLVDEDAYTSIHIEELETCARDMKLGYEEITRDIPGVSEEATRHLDEAGVAYIGAEVGPGDILVGKVSPKAEVPLSPEEKLLRAIFSDRAADMKDSSLRAPAGMYGTVIDVRIFSRRGIERDERSMAIERQNIQALSQEKRVERSILTKSFHKAFKEIVLGHTLSQKVGPLNAGTVLSEENWPEMMKHLSKKISFEDDEITKKSSALIRQHTHCLEELRKRFEEKVEKIQRGDDLPTGVLKMVKVFLAVKRKIQPGDKMAGRHGNKGVVSIIIPQEDMPFMADGSPIDIILNPLGLPSRMNVGQILETHLGWAAHKLSVKAKRILKEAVHDETNGEERLRAGLKELYPSPENQKRLDEADGERLLSIAHEASVNGVFMSSPAFEGAKVDHIEAFFEDLGLNKTGQETLYDGATGVAFDRPITVGYQYIMKLHHLVAAKIHARSIGPYSLVTQQPLGGKSQFGGQRFGEMEVWALQGYGAAHNLSEMLTTKSDDVIGRTRAYESIIKMSEDFVVDVPESFNVLIKELKTLALNVECLQKNAPNRTAPSERSGESVHNFDSVRISIASPEQIRSWSYGEVKKPETINYRTFKPERDGLFCARIFGPIKDYECLCGKYKRMKYRGIICERCGVELTLSQVRRERMGHIELASPVAHIWFSRSLPSRIGTLLDLSNKALDRILYFDGYVVIDPGMSPLEKGYIMSEDELTRSKNEYGSGNFRVGSGAEALKEMLGSLNLEQLRSQMRQELLEDPSEMRRKKVIKRLKLVEAFLHSGTNPEWMILDVIPVMPPDLRPLVPLDGGRFATSDLNDLYRRLINRNNRLRRLIDLQAPEMILRNEKRMLQEMVDAFFDNGRRGRPIAGSNKRPLKSLSDMLKGKQGRFRLNLLGKRVDYSGRSVIVVGPNLKLHQCGLPKKMALELFKPFVYARLERYGLSTTLKGAKRMVERERPEVWDILEEVVRERVVLLNRAPTLHRLSIQAFEPILVEGKAIQLHPLVCAAYNADFDGDQMAVHLPLSLQAQIEARVLMMSTNNILNPSNGDPVIVPSKDIILGLYYLTLQRDGLQGEGKIFCNMSEIYQALDQGYLDLHASVISFYKDHDNKLHRVQTTPGRLILWENLPSNHSIDFDMINKIMISKEVNKLLGLVYRKCGAKDVVRFVDHLVELGFKYATLSGISFGKDDLIVPANKTEIVKETSQTVNEYHQQYLDGLITPGERYNKITDAWTTCTERVAESMMKLISNDSLGKPLNSIYMMAHSGARGSAAQMRQLAAMRGLIARHDGSIIEHPIISNFKEGLRAFEYFNSTHGARKGLCDTALKTANAGYLTRRLVDVAQDCVVYSHDCGTKQGLNMRAIVEDSGVISSLADRILGRVSSETILKNGHEIVKEGTLIQEQELERLDQAGIQEVKVRSVLTCQATEGICALCYGQDMGRGRLVSIGEAVGVIAAQSIGEPGTQLTLRTFHSGGAAQRGTEVSFIEALQEGSVTFRNAYTMINSHNQQLVMGRTMELVLIGDNGQEVAVYKIPYGAILFVCENEIVIPGQKLAEWDPYTIPVIAETDGVIQYVDLVDGVSLKEVLDELTGITKHIIMDWRQTSRGDDLNPCLMVCTQEGQVIKLENGSDARYHLAIDTLVSVSDGQTIRKGDVVARLAKEVFKSRDITGGLPRITELFEARRPKDPAIMTECEGIVEYGKDYKTRRRLVIQPHDQNQKTFECLVPKGRHVLVQEGDHVKKGDVLVDGSLVLHDILAISGVEALAAHLVQEIQDVYRLQGVRINDKHIEVIIRQMLRKVEVVDPGETTFLLGDQVSLEELAKTNQDAFFEKRIPAKAVPVLQGITKASLKTDSFISAASFQETTRVLIEAAVHGKEDKLIGLKENVIAGRLIPAGTGFIVNRMRDIAKACDQIALDKSQQEDWSIPSVEPTAPEGPASKISV